MTKTTNTRCYLSKRQLLNLLTVANLSVDSVDKTSFRVFRFRTDAAPLRANLILIFFLVVVAGAGKINFQPLLHWHEKCTLAEHPRLVIQLGLPINILNLTKASTECILSLLTAAKVKIRENIFCKIQRNRWNDANVRLKKFHLNGNIKEFRLQILNLGCVRLGNPDLDFQNLNPDFPIKREIRKRISPPRNPSSGWISIKKSKTGFFGFPFLSFDWEIRKRIC